MSDLGDTDASGASDDQLIAEARAGGRAAFAELWNRHYAVAAGAARQLHPGPDSADLVSEAFAKIYDRILAGGGPTGAFRPYLYAVIRNLAARWGSQASHELSVDFDEQWDIALDLDDPALSALERSITVRAFRSLPERWQTVLWYTEVEGMDPHEVAPLMGLSPNGVAALSYRARDALRSAWLQAHIRDDGVPEDCSRTVSQLGEYSRKTLSARDLRSVESHLSGCTRCVILAEELEDMSGRLAAVLAPLIVGSALGSMFAFGSPSSSMAAVAPPLPLGVGVPAAAPIVGASVTASLASSATVIGPSLLIVAAILVGVPALGVSHADGSQYSHGTSSVPLSDDLAENAGTPWESEANSDADTRHESSNGATDDRPETVVEDIESSGVAGGIVGPGPAADDVVSAVPDAGELGDAIPHADGLITDVVEAPSDVIDNTSESLGDLLGKAPDVPPPPAPSIDTRAQRETVVTVPESDEVSIPTVDVPDAELATPVPGL